MTELPIYKIKGKLYFLDQRLCEYRNIKNPLDRLSFNSVGLNDLQKPTIKDRNIFIKLKGGKIRWIKIKKS